MKTKKSLLDEHKQNEKLPIRVVSPRFGHLSDEQAGKIQHARRSPYYFMLFMVKGAATHGVDLEEYDIQNNQLLIVRPHQIHRLPASAQGNDYFKIGFDERCLSRLPKQYAFLTDPLHQQLVSISPATSTRLKAVFEILVALLSTPDTDAELILAHLNSLLTEIDLAYFGTNKTTTKENLSQWVNFQVFVEDNLTGHPTIQHIADALALSTDSLYQIVKQHSGLSPKEFITNRLILEARRRISFGQRSSVKELAFELGFNDPDYFSRLFKKVTGKTIAAFFQELS
jgi:AraC family transcriptional regulator, transcriptional activator of pobA